MPIIYMETKIVCINPKCRADLKRPPVPYIKCPNCKVEFFVFCHEFPNTPFTHVDCKKCNRELYYFFCIKCSSVLSYTKYRMGSISTCKCGFSGCYVVCNSCHKPECYPPERRYEGVSWKCVHCKNPFNFMTCDMCFHEIYSPKFKEGESYLCKNNKCKANLKVKKCQNCKFIFMTRNNAEFCEPCEKGGSSFKGPNNNTSKYGKVEPSSTVKESKIEPEPQTSQKDEGTLCKICFDNEA